MAPDWPLTSLASTPTATLVDEYRLLGRVLAGFEAERRDVVICRFRRTSRLKGERCTRFFFDRYRSRGEQARIKSLKTAEGESRSSTGAMTEVTRDFYQKLFTTEPLDHQASTTLVDSLTDNFSDEAKQILTEDFTPGELSAIIQTLPSNKAPGPDGLTYELFKAHSRNFGIIMSTFLNRLLNNADTASRKPNFSAALITLLPKKRRPGKPK